jgi:hypothetical protein
MGIAPELLDRARAAGADLAEAEHRVLTSRADYHTAIRRMHLAGAPLREIAEALSISHQRVQQIVNVSGGSWWRRAWRTRRTTRDAVCTWCERPPSEVSKLVAGPNLYICDACVIAAGRVERATTKTPGPLKLAKVGSRERCSFCRKRATDARALVTGPAHICGECLKICHEIMEITAS